MVDIVNNWPYSDLHSLNLDWVLDQVKKLGQKIETMEGFFPQISDWNNGEWDIDHPYNPNEIVTNGNDIYMAKKNVPTGVNINNTDYWLLVGTDSYIVDKVDKSGDTMTGDLTLPGIKINSGSNPTVTYESTGGTVGATYIRTADNAYIIRLYKAGQTANHEDYKLPVPTADGYDKVYEFITTKDGVLGLLEHTESITVPAATWTTIDITQFIAPAGYKQIAVTLSGSTDFNARNNLYVIPNAMSNMNKLLVYCTAALSNVSVTLDAWFVREEDYKQLT